MLCLMEKNKAKICVPVCVQRANNLVPAIKRAAEVADIIELRLDCLPETQLEIALQGSSVFHSLTQGGLILTLRPAEQGGRRTIDRNERMDFWRRNRSQFSDAHFVDIEADLLVGLPNQGVISQFGQDRVICSHHDFVGAVSNLDQIYERMAATPARILKIAVQADDAIDCLPVFRLLEWARRDNREMIAIAMGQAGVMTRILGPSRGSFLTYGSLDDESTTAPGQLTARELREVFRIDHLDEQTEIMGLIGRPVTHSISPHLHNASFAAAGTNAVYIPFEVCDVDAFMRRMVHPRSREIDWKMRGLSVTAPHKSSIMQHLDWIEPSAKEIGAVNTIVVEKDELHGFNTDAEGFITPLRKTFGSLADAQCAIVGIGGAAKGAIWALQNENASVTLFSRNVENAKPLTEKLVIKCLPIRDAEFKGFDIVINATPVGTRGDLENETIAVAEQLRGVRLVYDLVYNPLETALMREACAAGCEVLGGLEMLIAQANEQFRLWTGRDAGEEVMRTAAMNSLNGILKSDIQ